MRQEEFLTASHIICMDGQDEHDGNKYVKDQTRTCGIESFWALLKRGSYGMDSKPLGRHIREFAGGHKGRPRGPTDQRSAMVSGMRGKRRLSWFDN